MLYLGGRGEQHVAVLTDSVQKLKEQCRKANKIYNALCRKFENYLLKNLNEEERNEEKNKTKVKDTNDRGT